MLQTARSAANRHRGQRRRERPIDEGMAARIKALIGQYPTFGYRLLWAMLRVEEVEARALGPRCVLKHSDSRTSLDTASSHNLIPSIVFILLIGRAADNFFFRLLAGQFKRQRLLTKQALCPPQESSN